MPKFVRKPVVVEAKWDETTERWVIFYPRPRGVRVAFTDKEFKKLYEEVKI